MRVTDFTVSIENKEEFLQETEKIKSLINQVEESLKKIDGMKMIVRLVRIESDLPDQVESHQN